MKITHEELATPEVDAVLTRQAEESAGRIGADAKHAGTRQVSLIHKSWFNLMIAGAVGAFAAWAIMEPNINDSASTETQPGVILLFPVVASFAGIMIGGVEGVLARNFWRAAKGAGAGLVSGFLGGFLGLIVAGIVFTVSVPLIVAIVGEHAASDPAHSMSALIGLMVMRSLAWGVVGMAAGLGPGIALKSKKLLQNGLLGGMLGGLIGGILFDPINYVVSHGTLDSGAAVSRAIGLTIIGGTAGAMIGWAELLTRDAWLLMTKGPLKGKQFTVFNEPTLIGSSPKCDIYLFKDESIEPFHGAIHIVRDGFEIEDTSISGGILVNGRKVKRQKLSDGNTIQVGKAEFIYSETDKEKSQ